MYEGNYKTRTKESVFSWDIVIGIIKELINDGKYLDTEKEEKTQLDLFSFSYDTSLYMMKYLKHHFLPILAYHNRLLMKHFAVALMIKTAEYKLLCISDGTEVLSITQECSNFFTALTVQALSLTVKRYPFGMMKTV